MKRLKSYKGDTTFITVFENGYYLINNGYYIVRADKGTTVETDSSKSENVLININSDYFLFEMNNDVKNDNVFFDHLKKYNQISLRNISKEEFDSY